MNRRLQKYLGFAGIAFAGFAIVGAIVTHVPPGALDRSELGTYGVAVPFARFFTAMGRFPTYAVLCTIAIVFGFLRRAWLGRAVVSVVGLIVVWQTSDVMKLAFHRARPPHPILAESSFGYPSGHADLSMFFYGLWAAYIWNSGLSRPVRFALAASLAGWIAAIGWSRLALGAHYPSDVAGGYAYGAGFLLLAVGLAHLRRSAATSRGRNAA